MERNSCIFYKSFYDSIKELDPQDQVQIYNAIFSYQFDNIEIDLKGVCKSIFTLIIPQLEANNKRYENGTKGGRPKTKTKPNENQKETKDKPNDNVNENDNVNNNIKENIIKERFKKPNIEEIEEYCKERKNGIDAERFYNFYESKNWMIGKNKMKDWKACVRTWERTTKQEEIPLPSWFNQEYKEKERTDEQEQQLQELIRGNQR